VPIPGDHHSGKETRQQGTCQHEIGFHCQCRIYPQRDALASARSRQQTKAWPACLVDDTLLPVSRSCADAVRKAGLL
jgi:hypothetical protein